MEAVVTEEIIAPQSTEAQAFIRTFQASIGELEGENAELQARIAELEAQVAQSHGRTAELKAENGELRAHTEELKADNADLRAWIRQLQRQAKGKTPQNSSLPLEHTASARPAAAAPAQVETQTRRAARPPEARAGLDSHRAVRRGGDAQAKPVSALWCEALRQRSAAAATPSVGSARDHRFAAVPERHVTEYQPSRLTCPCCGETTCAELPPGVPHSQSGPRLMAFVALLMAYYRQSRRRTAEFLGALLGQPCSPALAVKIQNQVTAALRRRMGPVRRRAERLLLRGTRSADAKVRATCRELYEHRQWLWTYLPHQRMESARPTFGWCPTFG